MEHNWAVVIPAKYILATDITSTQKLLLGLISGLSNMNGYCYASNDYLGKCLGISKIRVSQSLNDLKNKGYISINLIYKKDSREVESRRLTMNIDLLKKIDIPVIINDINPLSNSIMPMIENDKDNIYNNKLNNKVNKQFIPPTMHEVVEYFILNNSTKEEAEKAFAYYDCANWHDSKGKRVRNWKQKMLAVWINNSINKNKKTDYEQRVNHATSLISWAEQQDRANGIQ